MNGLIGGKHSVADSLAKTKQNTNPYIPKKIDRVTGPAWSDGVYIIHWNVLCGCGVGCLAMHMKVMTLGRWVGLRRGIGEVSG